LFWWRYGGKLGYEDWSGLEKSRYRIAGGYPGKIEEGMFELRYVMQLASTLAAQG
jgi:hypothetical protein